MFNSPPPYSGPQGAADGSYHPPPPPNYESMEGYNHPGASGRGYAPPDYHQQPTNIGGHGPHNTTVVMTQPTVAFVQQQFGDIPVRCRCPNCHADILTKIYFESGSFTWVLCIILFILLGFVLPCLCFIPFCMDGAKDVIHICPNCHQQIARYNRM